MKNEKIYDAITDINDEIIDFAAEYSFKKTAKKHIKRYIALAACLCIVIVGAVGIGTIQMGSSSAAPQAPSAPEAPSAGNSASDNSGYDGGTGDTDGKGYGPGAPVINSAPILPLTNLSDVTGLIFERDIYTDISSADDKTDSKAYISDKYYATNIGENDITVKLAYPYAGNAADNGFESLTVNGASVSTDLHVGRYTGYFAGVSPDDGGTWNLGEISTYEEYKALLDSGEYMKEALAEKQWPTLEVTVYEIYDAVAAKEGKSDCLAIDFDIDRDKTTVMTYGINGYSGEEDHVKYDFFLRPWDTEAKHYIVLVGEDIPEMNFQGYLNGACKAGEKIDVTYKVRRTEMDISEFIAKITDNEVAHYCAMERFWENGLFGAVTADRYDDGRLEDVVGDAQYVQRIMYRTFEVTVPAGQTVEISANYTHTIGWSLMEDGTEISEQYLRYATGLGSDLPIDRQTLNVKAGGNTVWVQGGIIPDENGSAAFDDPDALYCLIFKN